MCTFYIHHGLLWLLTFSCFLQGQIQVPREDSVPNLLLSKMVDNVGKSISRSPNTAYKIEFTVELQQENDSNATGFAVSFE